jgi:hypothetical protein
MRYAPVYAVMLFVVRCAFAQEPSEAVAAADAWRAKGSEQKVCGQIVDTSYATSVPNAPTYLYLDRPRPEQVFTVEIPSAKRDLFGDDPEKSLKGKNICVTAKIESDGMDGSVDRKHRAKVLIDDEDQITVR